MDETAIFYEYKPLKVIANKGDKQVNVWTGNQDLKKLTLVLTINYDGKFLEHGVILQRT